MKREVIDRSGRTWVFENYTSPSGPAFCVTLPDELIDWAGGFTAHFDGTCSVIQLIADLDKLAEGAG